jgi:phosphoribosylamine--glycine ligase
MDKVTRKIIAPTVAGLDKEGLVYHGFIFFGLMNMGGEPWVIEYNCRMGDPETEVVMPLLETDLVSLFAAMDNGTLADTNINFNNRCCATVMAVSGGYPGDYEKGKTITGLDGLAVTTGADTFVFHAGTVIANETIQTNGGRVLAVSSYGKTLGEAVLKSTAVLENIHFEGIYYRKDIGYEFPS